MMREVMSEALACPGMGMEDERVQKWAEYLAEDEQALSKKQMAQQEFMRWAMDSGRLSETEAEQILEDAVRKGQLPPFEEAKIIVRARRSKILEVLESSTAADSQASTDE